MANALFGFEVVLFGAQRAHDGDWVGVAGVALHGRLVGAHERVDALLVGHQRRHRRLLVAPALVGPGQAPARLLVAGLDVQAVAQVL